jgi:phage gpG-like protein
MTISFEFGDSLRRLEKIAKAMYGTSRKVADVRQNVADEMLVLIDRGFKTTTDPYGSRWAPKKRDNGKPTLQHTTMMRRSYFARVVGTRIVVKNTVEYSGYHQSGTQNMVARKTVPDRAQIPRSWEKPLREAARAPLLRYFKEAVR